MDLKNFIIQNYDKKRKWMQRCMMDDRKSLAAICTSKEFGSVELRNMLTDIRHVLTVGRVGGSNDLYIVIPEFIPNDKLVYILLECMIYSLFNDYGYVVHFRVRNCKTNVNTRGINDSVLADMMDDKLLSVEQFNKKFFFSINNKHFRKIVKVTSNNEDAPSDILSEVKIFLYRFDMADEFKTTLASTVSELVDNALEHAVSDCLIDIDVTEHDHMLMNDNNLYYGVNVVVLNFSDISLGDRIGDKLKNKYYSDSERYDKAKTAYNNHRKYFCKEYSEVDFFNITSFQQDISGRKNESESGGTGLTELIRTLEEYAFENYCYVLSGNNGILFEKSLLNFDKDNWIGFNDENDYLNQPPSSKAIFKSKTAIPGTGYNFLFIFKGEHNEESRTQTDI